MKKKLFVLLFAIVWCFIIYGMTASPSFSGEQTLSMVQHLFGLDYNQAIMINTILRKIAHISVFGLLTIFFYYLFKRRLFWAWLCTTLYAAYDEYHQSLVPNRTSSIYDILLDSFAAILVLIVIHQYKKKSSDQVSRHIS